jgi:hypothetical protein
VKRLAAVHALVRRHLPEADLDEATRAQGRLREATPLASLGRRLGPSDGLVVDTGESRA